MILAILLLIFSPNAYSQDLLTGEPDPSALRTIARVFDQLASLSISETEASAQLATIGAQLHVDSTAAWQAAADRIHHRNARLEPLRPTHLYSLASQDPLIFEQMLNALGRKFPLGRFLASLPVYKLSLGLDVQIFPAVARETGETLLLVGTSESELREVAFRPSLSIPHQTAAQAWQLLVLHFILARPSARETLTNGFVKLGFKNAPSLLHEVTFTPWGFEHLLALLASMGYRFSPSSPKDWRRIEDPNELANYKDLLFSLRVPVRAVSSSEYPFARHEFFAFHERVAAALKVLGDLGQGLPGGVSASTQIIGSARARSLSWREFLPYSEALRVVENGNLQALELALRLGRAQAWDFSSCEDKLNSWAIKN